MGNKIKFGKYETTNLSFEEVFAGEYDLPLNFSPRTVLDIGANEGAFTAWALEKWPECHVAAYEPVPQNAALFLCNHLSDSRVIFHPEAVANEPRIRLKLGKNNSGEASRYDLGQQNGESVDVDAIKPSSTESSEFVKIDTEGCEVEIISGLDLTNTKAVVCEFHRGDDKTAIINILQGAGFELVSKREYKMLPRLTEMGILRFARPDCIDRSKRSVFLAMPVYRQMDVFTCQSLLN